MKFVCEKSDLLDALSTAQRAVSQKSLIPALEGILLATQDGQVKITGYNLEMGIETLVDAQIGRPGTIVLNSRVFGEIVRKLPDGDITIEADDNLQVTIVCGKAEFNITGIKAADFPELPHVEKEKSLILKQKILKSMVRQTLYAVSQNDSKPVHTGELFELEDGILTVVAVDGYRLAKRKERVEYEQNLRFIIPGQTLSEVCKVLSDDEEKEVTVSLSRKHVLFEIDEITVVSRLLEGDFLNYKSAIPASNEIITRVDTRELLDSIDRASLLISEKNRSPLKLNIDDTTLTLNCITTIGKVHDEIEIESCGGAIEIGFNNRYLSEALKNSECESVLLKMNTPLTPCVVEPLEGDAFTFLVLPVKLRSGE